MCVAPCRARLLTIATRQADGLARRDAPGLALAVRHFFGGSTPGARGRGTDVPCGCDRCCFEVERAGKSGGSERASEVGNTWARHTQMGCRSGWS